MNYIVQGSAPKKYMEVLPAPVKLRSSGDVLEIIAQSWDQDVSLLMLHGAALSDDFYDLKTGIAGEFLQKLVNYGIKAAMIAQDPSANKGRFKEFASETNKGSQFRIFTSREAAEEWLTC